jgi:hypothetical protein
MGMELRRHQTPAARIAQQETRHRRAASTHLFTQPEDVEHHQPIRLQQDARPHGSEYRRPFSDGDLKAGLSKGQRRREAGYAAAGDRDFKTFRSHDKNPL